MEENNKEEKKSVKIRLTGVFCILLIIIIIALVCYMYVEKTNYDEEIKSLEANNVKMQSTINDLQGKLVLIDEEKDKNSNSVSTNNITNTVDNTDEDDLDSDEQVDEIAKELFESGSTKIRETVYSSYDQYELIIPSDELVVKGKVYEKRDALYSDIEDEYSKIFTDGALDKVLKERFAESDGNLYIISGSDEEWNISNVEVEKTSENDGEIEYKVTYNDVESDGTVSEKITCTMKIKLVDGEYRIFETDYCELM